MQCNRCLNGLLLQLGWARKEVTLCCLQARIHPYFPYFHVDVTAEVNLFSPMPGHTISASLSLRMSRSSVSFSLACPFGGHCDPKCAFYLEKAGQVNKIGTDYIGLLVLGIFNAAIGCQNIRAEFQHRTEASFRAHSLAKVSYVLVCAHRASR